MQCEFVCLSICVSGSVSVSVMWGVCKGWEGGVTAGGSSQPRCRRPSGHMSARTVRIPCSPWPVHTTLSVNSYQATGCSPLRSFAPRIWLAMAVLVRSFCCMSPPPLALTRAQPHPTAPALRKWKSHQWEEVMKCLSSGSAWYRRTGYELTSQVKRRLSATMNSFRITSEPQQPTRRRHRSCQPGGVPTMTHRWCWLGRCARTPSLPH